MFDYLKTLRDVKNFSPNKILDIGAWNGIWTSTVKNIWPNAHYTCIEAGEKHRKKLNAVTDDVHIAVLGDANKDVKIYLREITKGDQKKVTYTKGATLFENYDNYEVRKMQTLDQLVGADAVYDLIKQDVQGAEILIMQGAPQIFKRAKYVIQEVNLYKNDKFPHMPYESQMDNFMRSLGFNNSEKIDEHDGVDQIDKIYFNE